MSMPVTISSGVPLLVAIAFMILGGLLWLRPKSALVDTRPIAVCFVVLALLWLVEPPLMDVDTRVNVSAVLSGGVTTLLLYRRGYRAYAAGVALGAVSAPLLSLIAQVWAWLR